MKNNVISIVLKFIALGVLVAAVVFINVHGAKTSAAPTLAEQSSTSSGNPPFPPDSEVVYPDYVPIHGYSYTNFAKASAICDIPEKTVVIPLGVELYMQKGDFFLANRNLYSDGENSYKLGFNGLLTEITVGDGEQTLTFFNYDEAKLYCTLPLEDYFALVNSTYENKRITMKSDSSIPISIVSAEFNIGSLSYDLVLSVDGLAVELLNAQEEELTFDIDRLHYPYSLPESLIKRDSEGDYVVLYSKADRTPKIFRLKKEYGGTFTAVSFFDSVDGYELYVGGEINSDYRVREYCLYNN